MTPIKQIMEFEIMFLSKIAVEPLSLLLISSGKRNENFLTQEDAFCILIKNDTFD